MDWSSFVGRSGLGFPRHNLLLGGKCGNHFLKNTVNNILQRRSPLTFNLAQLLIDLSGSSMLLGGPQIDLSRPMVTPTFPIQPGLKESSDAMVILM